MKTLFLIRHGQTDWNIERRYQGQLDIELNENGRLQMAQTAIQLLGEDVALVVTSPLLRAKVSADIIADRLGLTAVSDPRLMEMDLGKWHGAPYGTRKKYPDWFESAPHGGETGPQFLARIQDWLDEGFEAETAIVVVHGLVIQAILTLVFNDPFEHWHSQPIKNGAITKLKLTNGVWHLVVFNEEIG
ncbi:MAG: histidine phosphatase family protein [Chloroflexota bacterium]